MIRELKETLSKKMRATCVLTALCLTAPVVTQAGNDTVSRTLREIHIEGEIAVPQVLFITSRDYPRYRDGLGLQFRLRAIDVARSVDLPKRLRIVPQSQMIKEEGP